MAWRFTYYEKGGRFTTMEEDLDWIFSKKQPKEVEFESREELIEYMEQHSLTEKDGYINKVVYM